MPYGQKIAKSTANRIAGVSKGGACGSEWARPRRIHGGWVSLSFAYLTVRGGCPHSPRVPVPLDQRWVSLSFRLPPTSGGCPYLSARSPEFRPGERITRTAGEPDRSGKTFTAKIGQRGNAGPAKLHAHPLRSTHGTALSTSERGHHVLNAFALRSPRSGVPISPFAVGVPIPLGRRCPSTSGGCPYLPALYEVACSGTDGTPIHRHMAGVVNRIGEPCVGSHCRRNQQRPVGGICDVVEVVDPPIHTPCDPRRIRPRYVRYPNRPDVDHRLATLRIEVPSNTHQVRQLATQHDLNRRATGERRVRCLHPLVGPVRFGEDGSQRPVDAHQIG